MLSSLSLCARTLKIQLFHRLSNITSSKSIVLNSSVFFFLFSTLHTAITLHTADVQCKFLTIYFFLHYFYFPWYLYSFSLAFTNTHTHTRAHYFSLYFSGWQTFVQFLKVSKLTKQRLTHDDLNNNKREIERARRIHLKMNVFQQMNVHSVKTHRAKFHWHCALFSCAIWSELS